jgi:hypothetical protein
MPGGRAIGQAIFHDQPNRGVNDAVGVMALGQGQVVHVGVEIAVAAEAAMLGMADVKFAGPAEDRIAQVMQPAEGGAKAIGASLALGAQAAAVVAASANDDGLG